LANSVRTAFMVYCPAHQPTIVCCNSLRRARAETENRHRFVRFGKATNWKVLADFDLDPFPEHDTKKESVIVFKEPSYGRSLLAAQLISGVLNRLRDYGCSQSLVWICPPLDLWGEPGFYRNGHFGRLLFIGQRSKHKHLVSCPEDQRHPPSNRDEYLRSQKAEY
jgi:hypothetical protein